MRRSSIALLAGITAALTIGASAPALAIDRFCTKWQYFVTYDRVTHTYQRQRGNCLHWEVIYFPQPVPPFFHFDFALEPSDPSPWITEREFKASLGAQRQMLNPQPLPPLKRKPKSIQRQG
jgi:hypothetical protein